MAVKKFLKAYCAKTKKYYGLEAESIGGEWKIVNMIPLSGEEAKLLSSEIKQSHYYTNDNLIPCPTCGSRRVGGCRCAKRKLSCRANMKYEFACTYCEDFKIDYSLPDVSSLGSRVGQKIKLAQGQEVEIRGADNKPLSRIEVGVGWDPADSSQSDNMDVDSSVVLLPANGNGYDLVYFGELEHKSGCVIHRGDNLTGDDEAQGDDENISVYLDKVPQNRDKILFVLNIYQCDERKQTLRIIKNLYIRLYDPDGKKPLIEYNVGNTSRSDTAIVIGMAYRSGSAWRFKAIGNTLYAPDVRALAEKCKNYL